MTTPTIHSPVGVRDFQVFALDENGYPAATGTSAYTGIDVSGVRDVTINDPEPRLISHFGDDRVFALDSLPPTEPLTGQVRVGKYNDALDEALTGNKSFAVGAAQMQLVKTDLAGSENQVGVLIFQQSIDTDPTSATYGKRLWSAKIVPKAQIIPLEPGMNENPTEKVYTFRPQIVSQHLWGLAFSTGTEGAVQAQLVRAVTVNKPRVNAFKGNSTTTTFTFSEVAISTACVAIWDAGVDGIGTAYTTGYAFTTAPAAGDIVVAWFEVPNTSGD